MGTLNARTMGLAALLACLPCVTSNADIVYNFVDYKELQNGYTLTGTITTDGTTGGTFSLSSPHILGWSWTATKGLDTFSVSSTDAGAGAYGTVSVSANSINMIDGATATFNNGMGGNELDYYLSGDDTFMGWHGSVEQWEAVGSPTLAPFAANGYAIATVPEPATWAALVGLGATGIVGYAWHRRRRAKSAPQPQPVADDLPACEPSHRLRRRLRA